MKTFRVTIQMRHVWFEAADVGKAIKVALALKSALQAETYVLVEYEQVSRLGEDTALASLPMAIGVGLC